MTNVFRDFLSGVERSCAALGLPEARLAVELPRDPSHGDWTTNAAMVLAKQVGQSPRALAEKIAPQLQQLAGVAKVDIAGPGFINVTMTPAFWQAQVAAIDKAGVAFGDSDIGGGVSTNVEYVSANPTGPMHTAHARNACFGDALANLLAKAGYKVTREFYINDAGNQVEILARSTHLRYREALGETVTIPEGMYPGEYLKDVGAALAQRDGTKWLGKPEAEWLEPVKRFATDFLIEEIKQDLAHVGVKMDVYTSERELRASGAVEACIKLLESRGLVYRGVLEPPKGKVVDDWEPKEQTLFRSTQFGDDVDRPLIKADGNYTYFAPDIAYHLDKYNRSGPILITVVGADHGGWVKRIKAAVAAVSEGKAQFSVKLYAIVNTFDNGVPVRMSKRAGTFVTLRDVVDRVGKDVLRFVMLLRKPEEVIDFDFVKVVEQSKDNPVFYVQYAHARCHSVARQAAVLNLSADASQLELLTDADELAMVKKLAEWPRLVEQAALAQEPHRVAYYLHEVAAGFHSLWNKGSDNANLRFVREDAPELTRARLALVAAVATVIASGLRVLGVEPVKEMR
jgi:arginyl-tRNA synthetase